MVPANIDQRPASFLSLPSEIKNINDLVFQHSRLRLDRKARDRLKVKETSLPLDLLTTPMKNALLGTCHAIRDEAMPVLAKHITLEIDDEFDRADPLIVLPPVFLQNVRALEVDINAFVHVTRRLLPSLKQITLTHTVHGIGTLGHAMHILHCGVCGGAEVFLREGLRDVSDWTWMQRQTNHLAREEGWEVKLRLKWECCSPKHAHLEVVYDVKSDKVLSMNGFAYGTAIDATLWNRAIVRVRELGETPVNVH